MGNGQTIGRGGARHAQQGQTANAAGVAVQAPRDGLAPRPSPSPLAARVTVDACPPASAGLPTTHGEQPLAFGARRLFGALGVRSSEQTRRAREGDQAGVWLWQPTGRTPSSPCSLDGRAEPARAGTNRVPPARDGRLAPPPDDWRGDDRGRHTRRRDAEADRHAAARCEAGQRRRARRAHGAGRPSPDALQVAVFARIGGLLVAPGRAPAFPEVAPRAARPTRVIGWSMPAKIHRSDDGLPLPVVHATGTLPSWRPSDVGQRVVQNGRASVSDPSSRAGRSGSGQEHHHGRAWPIQRVVVVGPAFGPRSSGTSCSCSSGTMPARRTGSSAASSSSTCESTIR